MTIQQGFDSSRYSCRRNQELIIWHKAIQQGHFEAQQRSVTMRIECIQCQYVCMIISPCPMLTSDFLCHVCTDVALVTQRRIAQHERARRQRVDDEPRLHVISDPALEATIKVEEDDENDNTPDLIYPL
jgi:hypothetical protein